MLNTINKYRLYFYLGLSLLITIILGGWWTGSGRFITDSSSQLIAIGRLFGLLAAFCILLEVILMSRLPFIEQNFDLHQINDLHRLNGYGVLLGIVGHIVFLVWGYAAPFKLGYWVQFWQFNTGYSNVMSALAGTVLLFMAVALSVKLARKRIRYEFWYLAHLVIYLAILLAFTHQLKNGGDFAHQQCFVAYWYFLYFLVFGLLGYYRFLRPLIYFARHQFTVNRVVQEANGICSIYITGRNINMFKYLPGQYATWRFLGQNIWYESHPYSFSAPPNLNILRVTVGTNSDFGRKVMDLKAGTKLLIDGPRGAFTAKRAFGKSIVLIAGGIGVAPYLASIKGMLDSGKIVVLLYSARTSEQFAFKNELVKLQTQGLHVKYYTTSIGDRIDQDVLQAYVGADTTVYICGPDAMSKSISNNLETIGLPKSQTITERFAM